MRSQSYDGFFNSSKDDIEMGLPELRRQLKKIEKEIEKRNVKESAALRSEQRRLKKAIAEIEQNKNMSGEELDAAIKSGYHVEPISGMYREKYMDPETGISSSIEVDYDNAFKPPTPKSSVLRQRTIESRSPSPFIPIPFETTSRKQPLSQSSKKNKTMCEKCVEGICPEGCSIMGGRRRKTQKRKFRKSTFRKSGAKQTKRSTFRRSHHRFRKSG